MTAKILISERAVLARLHRTLQGNCQTVKKFRPGSAEIERIGAYCLVDTISGCVMRGFTSLADLAEDFEILKPYEELSV